MSSTISSVADTAGPTNGMGNWAGSETLAAPACCARGRTHGTAGIRTTQASGCVGVT